MINKYKAIIIILIIVLCFSAFVDAQDFKGTNLSCDTLSYEMPPFTYEGSKMLTITFKTSPEVLRAMVPEPLTPNSAGVIVVYVGNFHVTQPIVLDYYEAAIVVPVFNDDFSGNYMPVLYLDKVLPITAGREIFGYSKVEADIKMTEDGNYASATVVRNGKTLIDITAQLGEPVVPIPENQNSPIYNLKLIPSVKKGAPPDVKQLTSSFLSDVKSHIFRGGVGKIKLGSLPSDPLGSIPVVEILGASYGERDFVLDYGEVVYDYLHH